MKYFKICLIAFMSLLMASCTTTKLKTDSNSQPAADDKHKSELKVMTYNVHHCNPPDKAGFIDIAAIAEVIAKQDPDIVALQEIDVFTGRSGKVNQAKAIAEKLKMHYYFAKSIDYDGGEYGVAILSRFPMTEEQTHRLPTQAETKGEPRVLATIKIALPGGKFIRFGSTHLDAQKASTNRLLQITEINRIASTEKLPMIIAGDFNAEQQSEVIAILDKGFQRSCQQCDPTIPEKIPVKAIDFIAFRPGSKFTVKSTSVIPEPYASDHLPVVAVFEIE